MPVSLPLRLAALNRLVQKLTHPKFLAIWFLLCALPMGLGCALLIPVGAFSDESQHCARADALWHGEIFGAKPPPQLVNFWINGGVRIDNGIMAVLFSKELNDASTGRPVTTADRTEAASLPWFAGMTYYPTQMVTYFPIMYAPAALGLLVAQTFGTSPLRGFYTGRVAMLLAYLVLGAAAVGLARFGNALLFAILTLPTSINLASSYNQDGLIIASCALAAALLSRCRPGPSRSWLSALALITAAVSAKPPYAALLVMCLPPLAAPGLARRAALTGLACLLPGLWLLHLVHTGFIAYQFPPYHPGPLWPGPQNITLEGVSPQDNLRVLLAHPDELIRLPLVSFMLDWRQGWPLLLGGIAWGNLHIPGWEYPCLAAALLAAAASTVFGHPGQWRKTDAGFAAVALFSAFTGMELSLYLTWTPVGAASIAGISPRYFLPLLPFFIFLLPLLARLPGVSRLKRPGQFWFCLPAAAMAAANIYALPAYISHIFHMPGP